MKAVERRILFDEDAQAIAFLNGLHRQPESGHQIIGTDFWGVMSFSAPVQSQSYAAIVVLGLFLI
jgi:hypothetical protein